LRNRSLKDTARDMDSLQTRVKSQASELTIAIVANEPEFGRALIGCWQSERVTPGFAAFAADPAPDSLPECDLVVAQGVPAERLPQLLKALDPSARPLIFVVAVGEFKQVRESFPQLSLVRQDEFWTENVIVLAGECMRRRYAILRAQRAEQALTASQRHVTLGKYVVEMRHNINNALTSVLGNAELLLLNAESFSGEERDQLETIRCTSLRLHEIMQRFWSLEAEMQVAERNSAEAGKASRTVGAPD
jgi:signal transduction histidine kinase